MKSRTWILLVSAFTVLAMISCDDDEGSDSVVNTSDIQFVMKASMANFTEITLGQVAADSAEDASIAQYGALMVSEHTAAQQRLQTVATSLGINLNATMDQQHQLLLDSLLTLKGSSFDSVYIHSQVRDHESAIDFFKQQSAHGLQRDIKSYVWEVLPQVVMHFQSATTLSQKF
jgi:putative membrane protein